jgi:hypothetical protein
MFVGDCTQWEGTIDGEKVSIKSSYKTTKMVDETKTKSNDMLKKNILPLARLFKDRKAKVLHLQGCPASIGDQVHYLSSLGKIENPNFDKRMLVSVNVTYWQMRIRRFINRVLALFGK